MKKIAIGIGLWIIFAVIPTGILLGYLITSYLPLQGIGHEYFYARGTLMDVEPNIYSMRFEESSTFWDTSDVAVIGSNLYLINITNPEMYQPGAKVIIKGTRVGFLGQIDQVTIYKNHFQLLGVDWRKTIIILFAILTAISLLSFKKFLNKNRF
ncbi:MAG TPA: hypothetical protein VJI69_01145 [Bacteroidia bacterium]|nr:hypothetical protein [Bacteroidia bacterium]